MGAVSLGGFVSGASLANSISAGRSTEASLLRASLGGIALAAVAISAMPYLPVLAAALTVCGLALNFHGAARLANSTGYTHPAASNSAYVNFLAIVVDVAGICTLIAALGLFGVLQSAPACMAAAMYLVVLLCALIKSNALKKPANAKVARIGRIAKGLIGAVTVISAGPHLELFDGRLLGAQMQSIVLSDFVALLSVATALAACVIRAARVGIRLSLKDPAPLHVTVPLAG